MDVFRLLQQRLQECVQRLRVKRRRVDEIFEGRRPVLHPDGGIQRPPPGMAPELFIRVHVADPAVDLPGPLPGVTRIPGDPVCAPQRRQPVEAVKLPEPFPVRHRGGVPVDRGPPFPRSVSRLADETVLQGIVGGFLLFFGQFGLVRLEKGRNLPLPEVFQQRLIPRLYRGGGLHRNQSRPLQIQFQSQRLRKSTYSPTAHQYCKKMFHE